ncbi:MAG: metallophosphoesterase family protein, partial [Candidatus Aureabacteria bacterium]|nr:metallophosphoesterase family protein [Candidatus Auribacterota bacterium]
MNPIFKLSLVCLLLLTGPATAAIIKGPYLQNIAQTGMRIRWETDAGSDSRVDYGPTNAYGSSISGEYSTYLPESNTYLHEIALSDLDPAGTYHYMVTTSGSSSADHTFTTAVAPGTTFRFAAYGDNRSQPAIHEAVTNAILVADPLVVLHVGDVVDTGTTYSEWETQFFTPAKDLFYGVPFAVAPGNHEGLAHWVTDFFYYPATNRWWSFDVGDAHFAIVDTENDYSDVSAQYAWLQGDLGATSRTWVFVFLHKPAYSSGSHGGTAAVQTYLVPLFEAAGVDMVFSGHDHRYERSYKDGITYIVTGGGGAPLDDPGDVTPNPYKIYSEITYHFCAVDISPTQLDFHAVHTDGSIFDSFSVTAAPTNTPTVTPTSTPTNTPEPPTSTPTATPIFFVPFNIRLVNSVQPSTGVLSISVDVTVK